MRRREMRAFTRGVGTMRWIVLGALLVLVIVVGHPVSATVTPPPVQVACDFVTGGGYIVGDGSAPPPPTLAEGEKGTFGVGGGVRNGAFWGHLEYNDHSTSPPFRVHGTSVTAYFAPDPLNEPNTRTIMGTAEVNGVDGHIYTVTVTDNKEPGRGFDEFSIQIDATTYAAAGVLAGGNIQLHKPNASNTPPPNMSCS
jgi:hypothetical protein